MVAGTYEARRTFGTRAYIAELPAAVCPHCGERTMASVDLQRFDAAVTRGVAASDDRDGATVLWLRKAAGLRQESLAGILSVVSPVTSATIADWEAGRSTIEAGLRFILGDLALDALDQRTSTADRLRSIANPPPPTSDPIALSLAS